MRFAAFVLCCSGMRVGFSSVALIVLVDGLKMMIRSGNMMGCGEMMVLTGWMVLGVGHGNFLEFSWG